MLYITCLHSVLYVVYCFFVHNLSPLSSTMFICKYFKAKNIFFLNDNLMFLFFSVSFLDLSFCSVTTSGITLHLTLLWAINSYCMVLYQSLMYNICITFFLSFFLPLLSSEFCISSEIMSYSLFMFNCHGSFFLYWVNRNLNGLWCKNNPVGL